MNLLELYLTLQAVIYLLSYFVPIFPSGTLGCGIFGGSAKEGKHLNIKKLLALGLYNVQRGINSCGYYYNGHIGKGIDKEANFGKYVSLHKLTRGTLPCEVFIGHTRKSTSGENTEENAHPHQIGNYVQTHNGTISNIWTLCNDRKIKHTHIHVDSIGLAHIIEAEKSYEVLNQYKGYAALATTWIDDPNKLYLYHGAGRETTNGTVYEERPLFTLETAEGIYYSSMEESLDFINENKAIKPKILPHNKVYVIEHGINKGYIFETKRAELDLNVTTYVAQTYKQPKGVAKEIPFNTSATTTYMGPTVNGKPLNPLNPKASGAEEKAAARPAIFRESRPPEYTKQDVYFWRGRYYRLDNILLHGRYLIDRDGMIIQEGQKSRRQVDDYYFIRGVMIRSKKVYNGIMSNNKVKEKLVAPEGNMAYYLSLYAKYPILCIEGEGLSIMSTHKDVYYYMESRANQEFSPKFSSRRYTIKYGHLSYVTGNSTDTDLFDFLENTAFRSIVDGSPAELSRQEVEKKLTKEINLWADKVIAISEVKDIPEALLILIDYVNEIYHGSQPFTEKQIEAETTQTIKDLIGTQTTLRSYLVAHDDHIFLRDIEIANCFNAYTVEEINEMENRYNFIEFGEVDEIDDVVDDIIIAKELTDPDKDAPLKALPPADFDEKKAKKDMEMQQLARQLIDLERQAEILEASDGETAREMAAAARLDILEIRDKLRNYQPSPNPIF